MSDNELCFTKLDCSISYNVITLKRVQDVIFYIVIKMIMKNNILLRDYIIFYCISFISQVTNIHILLHIS